LRRCAAPPRWRRRPGRRSRTPRTGLCWAKRAGRRRLGAGTRRLGARRSRSAPPP
jgi:hypothetical protein